MRDLLRLTVRMLVISFGLCLVLSGSAGAVQGAEQGERLDEARRLADQAIAELDRLRKLPLKEQDRTLLDELLSELAGRPDEAVAVLFPLCEGGNRGASNVMSEIGEPLVPALTELLRTADDAQVPSLLGVLSNIPSSGEQAAPLAIPYLLSTDYKLQSGARYALKGMGASAVPAISAAFATGDKRLKLELLKTMQNFSSGLDQAVPMLSTAIVDPDREVQLEALKVMRKTRASAAGSVKELVRIATCGSTDLQQSAREVLAGIGEPALAELYGAYLDGDARVRKAAVQCFGSMGTAGIPFVSLAVDDEDWEVRSSAVGGLNRRWDTSLQAVRIIASALEDEHPGVRRSAVMALDTLEPGMPLVTEALLKASKDQTGYVRYAAVFGMQEYPDLAEAFVPVLLDLLRDRNNSVRSRAVDCLGSYGEKAAPAAEELYRLAVEGDPDMRYAAQIALMKTGARPDLAAGSLTKLLELPEDSRRMKVLSLLPTLGDYGLPFFPLVWEKIAEGNTYFTDEFGGPGDLTRVVSLFGERAAFMQSSIFATLDQKIADLRRQESTLQDGKTLNSRDLMLADSCLRMLVFIGADRERYAEVVNDILEGGPEQLKEAAWRNAGYGGDACQAALPMIWQNAITPMWCGTTSSQEYIDPLQNFGEAAVEFFLQKAMEDQEHRRAALSLLSRVGADNEQYARLLREEIGKYEDGSVNHLIRQLLKLKTDKRKNLRFLKGLFDEVNTELKLAMIGLLRESGEDVGDLLDRLAEQVERDPATADSRAAWQLQDAGVPLDLRVEEARQGLESQYDQQRRAVIQLLSQVRNDKDDAAEILAGCLWDDHKSNRIAAARALVTLGYASMIDPAALEPILNDGRQGYKSGLAPLLGELDPSSEGTVHLLRTALDCGIELREAAESALQAAGRQTEISQLRQRIDGARYFHRLLKRLWSHRRRSVQVAGAEETANPVFGRFQPVSPEAMGMLEKLRAWSLTEPELAEAAAVLVSEGSPVVARLLAIYLDDDYLAHLRARRVLLELGDTAGLVLEDMLAERRLQPSKDLISLMGEFGPVVEPTLLLLLEHRSEQIRESAVYAMSKVSPLSEAGLRKLVGTLGDRVYSVQGAAKSSLGSIGAPAAPMLIEALGDPNPELIAGAAESLARMEEQAGKEAVEPLLALLSHPDGRVRQSAHHALGHLAALDPRVVPALRHSYNDSAFNTKQMAFQALYDTGEKIREAMPEVVDWARSQSSLHDSRVPRVIARYGEDMLPLVRGLLDSENSWIRADAAKLAGRLGGGDADMQARLRELTSDGDARVREGAIGALGGEGKDKSAMLRITEERIADNDPKTREAALKAHLRALDRNDEALPLLSLALCDESSAIRIKAVADLAGMPRNMPAVEALLMQALDDNDYSVRNKAAEELRKRSELHPELAALMLQRLDSPDAALREFAARELGQLAYYTEGTVARLVKALDDPSCRVVEEAAQALGAFGESASPGIPGLIAYIERKGVDCSGSAVRSLGEIGPEAAQAVDILVEVVRDGGEWPAKAAIDSLMSIAPADARVQALLSGRDGTLDPELTWHAQRALDLNSEAVAVDPLELIERLRRRKVGQQLTVLDKLSDLGESAAEAVPLILEIHRLTDGYAPARIRALGNIGADSPEAMAIYRAAAVSDEPQIRLEGALALAKITGDYAAALPVVVEIWEGKYFCQGRRAMEALGELGPAAIEALQCARDGLTSDSESVRKAARDSLKKITGKTAEELQEQEAAGKQAVR